MSFDKLKSSLERHRYRVSVFPTAAEAVSYLTTEIRDETIGFGGSMTVDQTGLYDKLASANKVFWHWKDVADRDRFPEFTTYVTSVNAVAETGEMVNIDGTGNRLAASLYGPKKVWFLIGKNKVTADLTTAIERARRIASPLNAKRYKMETPCVADGKCHDCNHQKRICNALTIYMRPMLVAERTEVVLIDEDLGF